MKYLLLKIFYISIIAILISLVVGVIAVEIYVWINYANTPISELPAWVAWFMWRR